MFPGHRYSVGEVEPREVFMKNMSTEKGYFQILNHDNGDLVSALVLKPSPLARSEHTVHFGGPITVSPTYRGKGNGHIQIDTTFYQIPIRILLLFFWGNDPLKLFVGKEGQTSTLDVKHSVAETGKVRLSGQINLKQAVAYSILTAYADKYTVKICRSPQCHYTLICWGPGVMWSSGRTGVAQLVARSIPDRCVVG